MKKTKTNEKESYETPEVLDIKPVTICRGGNSLNDDYYDSDEG
jgi:CDGSH-type Zn-finger protein